MKTVQKKQQPAKVKPTSPFFDKSGQQTFFGNTQTNDTFFSANNIQPKLTIGEPNDKYEIEADNMADRVVKQPTLVNSNPPDVQNKCADCGGKEKEKVQKMEEEEVQRKTLFQQISPLVQRMESEEEEVQTKSNIQRMESEEEEVQMKSNIQKMESEEEEVQMKSNIQKMEGEEEEVQMKSNIQKMEGEEEEVQTKSNIQRMEGEEEEVQMKSNIQKMESEEENIQMRTTTSASPSTNFETQLRSSKGQGSRLPDKTRTEMESGFGADFSGVRVHTDSNSVEMNRNINAQAFTHGSDIYFNANKFQPESKEGKHLLAHELTHTVQQGAVNKVSRQPEPETDEFYDPAAELLESNREAEDAIDPNPANESRQQADAVIENVPPPEVPPAPEPAPAPTPPPPRPAAPAPQNADTPSPAEPEKVGETAKKMEEASANVCGDAGKKAGKLAANEQTHDNADDKLGQTESAVIPPAAEGQASSNTDQVGELDAAPDPATDDKAAKQKMEDEVKKAVPTTIKSLNSFKSEGKAKVVGNEVMGEVNKEVGKVKESYNKIEEPPPPQAAEPSTELPATEIAPSTGALNLGKDAVPPMPAEATDFTEFDKGSDDLLVKEEIGQEQLDMVDSGDLAEANKERKGLKDKTQNEPAKLQEFAQKETKQVDTDMKQEERKDKAAMKAKRQAQLQKTKEEQKGTKSKLELKREAVATKINGIYERAKKSVTTKLENLEKQALAQFDAGQALASTQFEDNVNRRVNTWKSERYSGLLGGAKWVKDKFMGIDDFPAIKNIFETERTNFVNKIDQLIIAINKSNNDVIEGCKQELAAAKLEIKEYVDGLGPELKDVGQKSMKEMETKLQELDGFIDKKKEELQQKLCDKKEAAIKAIDKKIEEMKASMSGILSILGNLLLDAMMKFFKWALEKAGYSPDDIMSIINQGKAVIKKIVTDPIGFIMNIVTAVGNGIGNFKNNIKQHLIGGLVNWLTGAMGDVQIQLPEKWDLKGILSMVMQVLGVGWGIIRQKLVKEVGEKVVSAAETGIDIVKRIINEGPIALWEMIKEKAAEIKQNVMEGIRNWVITNLVKEGIKKLLSMLTPAGAIVQAIIGIYNTIMFFVENWDRIVNFVKTVFNSIKDMALGKLAAASKAVEDAMVMTLPIIMNFLARFIGLGGIGKSVSKIIGKVRKPIDKVVGKVVKFIAKKVRKLFGKGGKKKRKVEKDVKKADKIQKGLNAIDKEEKRLSKGGAITKEDALKIAKNVKSKHSVFKSLKIVDGEETWDYEYTASPKKKKRGKKKSVDDIFVDKEIRAKIINELPIIEKKFPAPKDGQSWVAVFPSKGRQLKVKVGDDLKPATIGNLLGGEEALKFRTVMVEALESTILKGLDNVPKSQKNKETQNVQGDNFSISGLRPQVIKEIGQVANKTIKYLMKAELFSIGNTGIPRKLRHAKKSKIILTNNKSISGSLYSKIAKKYNNSYRAKFKGEVHHAIPLYLGGSHNILNLLKVNGQAKGDAAESAHRRLHDFIDDQNVTIFLEKEGSDPEKVELQNLKVEEVREKLKGKNKLLFGKLYTDGEIKYKETQIKVK